MSGGCYEWGSTGVGAEGTDRYAMLVDDRLLLHPPSMTLLYTVVIVLAATHTYTQNLHSLSTLRLWQQVV